MEVIVYEADCRRFQFVTAASYLETGGHEASCGHMVKSNGLREWCKDLSDLGRFTFNCPKCAKEWPWQEVRHLAQLSQEECRRYEEQFGRIMAEKKEMYRKCPVCSLYVQRMDAEKLCVQCLPCSEKSKKTFQFCWECQREWKNTDVQSNNCGNESCSLTALLLGCGTTEDQASPVYGCPEVRACPNCETLTQHCTTGCPSVTCPNCCYPFCYRCLELIRYCTDCQIVGRQKLTGKKADSKWKAQPSIQMLNELLDDRLEQQINQLSIHLRVAEQQNQQPENSCVVS